MILVTGANGQLGQAIIEQLVELNASNVIAGVRNTDAPTDLSVPTRTFDYDQPTTMQDSLEAVKTLVLVSGNAPIELRMQQHQRVIDAAKLAGVEHIIYTSFITARQPQSHFPFSQQHVDTEARLKASGINSIILRNGYYMENLQGGVLGAIEQGALVDSAPSGDIAFVSRTDLAMATAKIAIDPSNAKAVYELTGHETHSMAQVAKLLSNIVAKPIGYKAMPVPEYDQLLQDIGLPPFVADALAKNGLAVDAGEYQTISPDLQQLLGRAPTSLSTVINQWLAA